MKRQLNYSNVILAELNVALWPNKEVQEPRISGVFCFRECHILAGSARLAVDYISRHCTAGVNPFPSFRETD
jgi:hypothetical protein